MTTIPRTTPNAEAQGNYDGVRRLKFSVGYYQHRATENGLATKASSVHMPLTLALALEAHLARGQWPEASG